MNNLNYLETSGWLNSLKLGKVIDYQCRSIPWYCYPAIEFIEDKLKSNFRVFEYGSGQSSLWYAQRVAQVISVEHNFDYFQEMSACIPKNVKLVFREDSQRYVDEINNYSDGNFDVIVIDGIERVKCAEICGKKLSEYGWIVFDNSDRELNDQAIIFFHNQGFKRIDFYGLVASQKYKTCTSIFFKKDNFLSEITLPSKKESCLGISLGQAEARIQKKQDNFLDKQIKSKILSCYEEIKKTPNSPEVYKQLGDLLQEVGKVEAAMRAYTKAVKLNPDFIGSDLP
ncbi:MAG: hypothetical protein QNJ68_14680 [Microcoleaceae cyanobacterium MO_207.B10]|nr:hypothetical protein [Microcoleaceae cyanobacterium MO_207.B10]